MWMLFDWCQWYNMLVAHCVYSFRLLEQITDNGFLEIGLAWRRARTRRRSPLNLPKPLMKWSPCLKIVTQGPSVYQRVRFAKIIMLVFLNVEVKLSPEFSCLLPVTTLRQRLLQPDFQPAGASQLHPRHKHLLMKRSLRCRVRTLCSTFPIKCCCFF